MHMHAVRDDCAGLHEAWGSQFLQEQQSDSWRALQIIFVVRITSQIIHQRRTGVPRLRASHDLMRLVSDGGPTARPVVMQDAPVGRRADEPDGGRDPVTGTMPQCKKFRLVTYVR